MNGIRSCGGYGTDGPSSGGVGAVTQPTFVVIAIATRDAGWLRMAATRIDRRREGGFAPREDG
jgi:hypothetical protein